MDSETVRRAMAHVRADDVDSYVPLETLANLAGAVRRATERRVGNQHLEAGALAAGLAAELGPEAAALRGEALDANELEQRVHDAAARTRQANESGMRPLSGPAAYARAQEKVEDLIRGYARGLRMGEGELLDGALAALEAEAVGFAGELAAVVDDDAR